MDKKNFWIDIGILLAFLVAMEPRFGGIAVHEWLSIALAAAIVIHLLLHWQWIVGVGGRFFRRLWHVSRLKFAVDALLFAASVVVMLSGLLISRSALPALGIPLEHGGGTWRALHALSADLSILLVGLHFALNWDWVVRVTRRYLLDPLAGLRRRRAGAQPAPASVPFDEER